MVCAVRVGTFSFAFFAEEREGKAREMIANSMILFLMILFFYDVEKFNVEDECHVGCDGFACSVFAVSEIGRDVKLPLGADGHKLKGFYPPWDYAVNGEIDRFAAAVGAIEYVSVDKAAFVVAAHGVGDGRFGTCSFDNDFVLQSAACNFDVRVGF